MEITESKAERAGGIILGVFSLLLYFVLIPAEIADAKALGVSPRFLPQAVGILLFTLSVALFISGYKKRNLSGQKVFKLSPLEGKLVIKSLAIVAAYIVAFELAGYIVPSIVTLALLMYMYGQRRKTLLVAISVGFPLFVYFAFTRLLHMVLP